MALSDKNLIITPSIGSTNTEPKIDFVGASTNTGPSTITATVYPTNNGTLSFDGTAGNLFSITNNLVSGSIFSVNPISGIPIIDVNADRTIALNPYGGNTGIGLTNPGAKLDVSGDMRLSSSDAEIEFNSGGARLKGRTNALSIHTGGGLNSESLEQVRINSTGVGIGNTNPSFSFQVGPGNFGNISGKSGVGIDAVTSSIFSTFGTGGNFTLRAQRPSDVGGGDLFLGGSARGDFRLNSIILSTNSIQRVIVDQSGRLGVGIGTTNPIQPVQIGTGSTVVVIDSLGEVGIGTTNPTVKLQVIGDASISGVITASSFSGTATSATTSINVIGGIGSLSSLTVSGISTLGIVTASNIFSTGIITASGGFNLGISSAGTVITSGPIQTLNFIGAGNTFNVNGTTVDISISGGGGGSSSQWVTTTAGIHTLSNVGIGTTNPQVKLDVVGTANISNDLNISGNIYKSGMIISPGANLYLHANFI